MDFEDFKETDSPCKVCGFDKIVIREGYEYCLECGTRAADSQPILDHDEIIYSGVKKKKIKKSTDSDGNIWSTWHCYNIILVALTEELGLCSLKQDDLKPTVLKLWGKFLKFNQIAFFSKKATPLPPKLIFGFHKKDLMYLYKMKKPTRKSTNNLTYGSKSQNLRQMTSKRRSMFLQEYIQSSQQSNTEVSQLFTNEGNIESPKSISFKNKTKKYFKKYMTEKEIKHHMVNGYCGFDCNCFFRKKKSLKYYDRVHYLSIFNLYALLALAIRINDDDIQISDLIRWCREGHITYGKYSRLFPEDMIFKSTDPKFYLSPNSLSYKNLQKTLSIFAKKFNLGTIKAPDLKKMVSKYIKELELPKELVQHVLKLKDICDLPHYETNGKYYIPNYEAIAVSYIIVTLKMIFGLDDVTENEISTQCENINTLLSLNKIKKELSFVNLQDEIQNSSIKRLFVWKSWMKYIEYRKICLKQYYYPVKMQTDPNNCENPSLFLKYKQFVKKDEESKFVVKNKMNLYIKSLLEEIRTENENINVPAFPCTLYPLSSYAEVLLFSNISKADYCSDILEEDFSSYSISFLFDPTELKNILAKSNIILKIFLMREDETNITFSKIKCENQTSVNDSTVRAINSTFEKWNEFLQSERNDELIDKIEEKVIKKRILPKNLERENSNFNVQKLTLCSNDYWIRHYKTYSKISQNAFESELESYFSDSFSWLLKECSNMIEMSPLELYKEVCVLENKLMKKGVK